jgi:hypothetical protein
VSEDVDDWDESKATVANLCLDAVSDSVDMEYGNIDVDINLADSQMDVEDVGDMVVDDVKPEVNELDADVLDEVLGDDTGEVEVLEGEEDDGTVVVQALPVPVHIPFLTAIPDWSGGPGG